MPPDGELCGACRTNLNEEGCCPNPHCPTNKCCPRCGSRIGPDLKCVDDECGTNRLTVNPSEHPQSRGPYTSKPPRRQSFKDLMAQRIDHPQAAGLYSVTMERGSVPAPPPPSIERPATDRFKEEEPPTLRNHEIDRTRSGVHARVDIQQSGTADTKKGT